MVCAAGKKEREVSPPNNSIRTVGRSLDVEVAYGFQMHSSQDPVESTMQIRIQDNEVASKKPTPPGRPTRTERSNLDLDLDPRTRATERQRRSSGSGLAW